MLYSKLWGSFTKITLKRNMRVERLIELNPSPERIQKLKNYAEWLLKVGDGTLETKHQNLIEIPNDMVCQTKAELEEKVFPNFIHQYNNQQYLSERAIMTSTNDIIQKCNYEIIRRLPGELVVSESIDECIEDEHKAIYDSDFLNRINTSGIPPHRLALKKNACIILIKNLNHEERHCNGTRYMIISVTKNLIHARKLNGDSNSDIMIPRIPNLTNDSSDFPIPFKRLQFPILCAYYLSFNRAQGQSLKKAGLYLPRSVFSHGHLYVGFSRCGDPDGVHVYADQEEFENVRQHLTEGKTYTRNIVYKEIFNS